MNNWHESVNSARVIELINGNMLDVFAQKPTAKSLEKHES